MGGHALCVKAAVLLLQGLLVIPATLQQFAEVGMLLYSQLNSFMDGKSIASCVGLSSSSGAERCMGVKKQRQDDWLQGIYEKLGV